MTNIILKKEYFNKKKTKDKCIISNTNQPNNKQTKKKTESKVKKQ
jgi:hypothetical protein